MIQQIEKEPATKHSSLNQRVTRQQEIVKIARTCYERGYIPVIDYIKICTVNKQLAF